MPSLFTRESFEKSARSSTNRGKQRDTRPLLLDLQDENFSPTLHKTSPKETIVSLVEAPPTANEEIQQVRKQVASLRKASRFGSGPLFVPQEQLDARQEAVYQEEIPSQWIRDTSQWAESLIPQLLHHPVRLLGLLKTTTEGYSPDTRLLEYLTHATWMATYPDAFSEEVVRLLVHHRQGSEKVVIQVLSHLFERFLHGEERIGQLLRSSDFFNWEFTNSFVEIATKTVHIYPPTTILSWLRILYTKGDWTQQALEYATLYVGQYGSLADIDFWKGSTPSSQLRQRLSVDAIADTDAGRATVAAYSTTLEEKGFVAIYERMLVEGAYDREILEGVRDHRTMGEALKGIPVVAATMESAKVRKLWDILVPWLLEEAPSGLLLDRVWFIEALEQVAPMGVEHFVYLVEYQGTTILPLLSEEWRERMWQRFQRIIIVGVSTGRGLQSLIRWYWKPLLEAGAVQDFAGLTEVLTQVGVLETPVSIRPERYAQYVAVMSTFLRHTTNPAVLMALHQEPGWSDGFLGPDRLALEKLLHERYHALCS